MKNKIKITTLIFVAMGISSAINLSEFLSLINSSLAFFKLDHEPSVWILSSRIPALMLYCFLVLFINSYKIDEILTKCKKEFRTLCYIGINTLIALSSYLVFIQIHEWIGVNINTQERKGLGFIWIVILLFSMLIATLLKFRTRQLDDDLREETILPEKSQSNSLPLDKHKMTSEMFTSCFLLSYRGGLIPVKTENFALFYLDSGEVKGLTFDGESYAMDKRITELERRLNPIDFYRVNRQQLVNRNAVIRVEPHLHGKINLRLSLDFDHPIVVSKLKSAEFKDWLVNNSVNDFSTSL